MIVEDLGYEKNQIVLDLRINSKNKRQGGNLRGNKQYYLRHTFHKKFVSKIFYHLCSKKIRTFIFHLLKKIDFLQKGSYKIIDISCGYDDLFIEIAEYFENSSIIGNDLHWQHLFSLPRKKRLNNVILTKCNILLPEFCQNEHYDLIICKNTLHHLPRWVHLYLLKKLVKAGNNIIIVEIEDPLRQSIKSFIWNFYYKNFLKDNGKNFLDSRSFMILLKKLTKPYLRTSLGLIKTIKGNYLIGVVEQKIDPILKNDSFAQHWREKRQ